ncbi:MAG TPA: DUF4126 domain-containing protein [Methylibium sp.]|nr:DUF4126 domain-containing protein [Methylibium sp.]
MDAIHTFDTTQLIALAATLGWASGLRLYAVLAITGLVGYAGWVPLPPGLQLLQHPAMLAASGFMVFVEFFADKIPGLDTLWDLIHTVVRIPAGAALAAAVFGADHATAAAVAALVGGTLAATSHAAKASTRAAANTSPEPFSNLALSLLGDLAVPGMLWLAFEQPVLAIVLVAVAFVAMLVLTWLLSKFLFALWRRVQSWFGDPTVA